MLFGTEKFARQENDYMTASDDAMPSDADRERAVGTPGEEYTMIFPRKGCNPLNISGAELMGSHQVQSGGNR